MCLAFIEILSDTQEGNNSFIFPMLTHPRWDKHKEAHLLRQIPIHSPSSKGHEQRNPDYTESLYNDASQELGIGIPSQLTC
jgi:hypothetical protein